jgi:hypothetical protein
MTCLEEDPARDRAVQHLGEGELRLQHQDLIAVACGAVGGGERVRQPGQPLAQQPVDGGRVQRVAELLQPSGVSAGGEAVVQGLERDPGLGRLALGPLVAVDAQLGVGGE